MTNELTTQEAKEILEAAKKCSCTITHDNAEREMHIYIGDEGGAAAWRLGLIQKLKKPSDGMITFSCGTCYWVEDDVVFNRNMDGADAYVWDSTGDKVKHDRVRVCHTPDGNKEKEKLRVVYAAP